MSGKAGGYADAALRQRRGSLPGAVQREAQRVTGNAPSGMSELGRKHRPDYWLVILCLLMLSIGLIVVYAISPALSEAAGTSQSHYVSRQLFAIGLSIMAFVFMAKVPLPVIRQYAKPLLVFGGLATLVALLMPVNPLYPAHRWVRLGNVSFQSVELLKFGILITAAGFLAERSITKRLGDWKATIRPLLIAIGVLGLVVAGPGKLHAQSDLGSTAVIFAMLATMAFVAGMPLKKLAIGVAVLAVLVTLVVLPSDYRRARVTSFLHPDAGCQQAEGYQACQALIAVGSGGMFGLGLGRSVQAYGYLPEAANDSIFAIYAEKFGFVGVTVLLGIMLTFFSRIKNIAERAPDMFSRLLVVGVLAWLSIQASINIGAMIGLLPLKGITLPFISYGGTSVVFAAAAVGLVFQVSYYTTLRVQRVATSSANGGQPERRVSHDNQNKDSGGYGRRQRGAYHPNPSGRSGA